MTSLKSQAVRGVKWTTLQTLAGAGIGTLLYVLQARFLSPAEFASIAIIMIFIGLSRILENFGISQAVIQRNSITPVEGFSLLIFNIILSIIFAAALYFGSPIVALFFSLPELEHYLKLLCLMVLFSGPAHYPLAMLEKNLFFKELSLIEIWKQLILFAFVITFLILGYGVLSIIYGYLIMTFSGTLLIIIIFLKKRLLPFSPNFKLTSITPFLRFGSYVSGKEVMTYITHRADEVIIGYFLPPEILGIYHLGKHMLEKLRVIISSSFRKVLYVVFSKLKNDIVQLLNAYQKITRYISLVAFPVFIGIAITAHLFVPVIFGREWVDSVIVFQVFSLSLIPMVLTANISSSLLYSVNKPGIVFYIDVYTNTLYIIGLILVAQTGLIAILILYSSYVIIKSIILQYHAHKQLAQPISLYAAMLRPAFVFSFVMAAGVILFQAFTHDILNIQYQFLGSIGIGVILYIFVIFIFGKTVINEFLGLITEGPITN